MTIVVRDQEEALRWYTEKLGFEKRSDDASIPGMRWLTVAPKNQKEVEIVLASPEWYGEHSEDQVGKGTTIVLVTDDCKKDYETLRANGVAFEGPPEDLQWGVSALFVDLYGNPFNLLQPSRVIK